MIAQMPARVPRHAFAIGLGCALAWGGVAIAQETENLSSATLSLEGSTAWFREARLLTAQGKTACLWDLQTGKAIERFVGHQEVVRAVAFSPDGMHVLTGAGRQADLGSFSTDNSARLWDVASGREIVRLDGHVGHVHTVQFSPDGKRILTAGRDGTIRIWDSETGQPVLVFARVAPISRAAAFDPAGHSILGLMEGGRRIVVWNATTGAERFRIERGQGFFETAEFSPHGEWLLTATSQGVVETWGAKEGEPKQRFVGHQRPVHQAFFTRDGRNILTASSDRTVRMWDANTGEETARFEHPGAVLQLLIGARGERFFAKWRTDEVPVRGGVSLWDVKSGQEILHLAQSEDRVIAGFSPDGKTFIVTSAGTPTALRNAATGAVVRRFR